MIDSEKKMLNGFLSKTLKMTPEEVDSLYNESGELTSLNAAEEADSARVTKLKEDSKSQYGRGQKEVAAKLEAKLKEKYEVDSDLTGVELIDLILAQEVGKVKTDGKDISAHPDFVKARIEHEKELKATVKEWQAKLNERDAEFQKQTVFTKVKERALAELRNLRPILPEDARKAQRWEDKFVDEFKSFEYQEHDGSFVIMKDGKALEDSHGHPKSFTDYVKETASDFFDFQTSESRSSAGNKNTESTAKIAVPKNDDEFAQQMRDLGVTPENAAKRVELTELYTKSKKQ